MKIFLLLTTVLSIVRSDLIGYNRLGNNVHYHKLHSGNSTTRNHARGYNLLAKIADFLAEKEGKTIDGSILSDVLEYQKSMSHKQRLRSNPKFSTYMKLFKGN